MKTLTALILLCASIAGAQTITSTNIVPYTFYTGTNNSYEFITTNLVYRTPDRIQFNHGGITNFNALNNTNVIIRLQLNISNTWVTIQTFYPTATNANTTDNFTSTARNVAIPARVQVVTTNQTAYGVFSEQVR